MSVGLKHGKWSASYSPTSLEWHFAAGLNVSTCSADIETGDFNGAFSRLRFLTSLRLIEEAARSGIADTELILCVGETPLTIGNWCLTGAQPIFESVTNVAATSLPLPHWLPRLRDNDFSVWDEAMRAQLRERPTTAHQQRRAVFRGGVYRLSVLSDRWRERGPQHSVISSSNWRHVGRTALFKAMSNRTIKPHLNVCRKTCLSLTPHLHSRAALEHCTPPFREVNLAI